MVTTRKKVRPPTIGRIVKQHGSAVVAKAATKADPTFEIETAKRVFAEQPTAAAIVLGDRKANAGAIRARHANLMDSLSSPEVEEELGRLTREHQKRLKTGTSEVTVLETNMLMDRASDHLRAVFNRLAGNEISDNLREMVENLSWKRSNRSSTASVPC